MKIAFAGAFAARLAAPVTERLSLPVTTIVGEEEAILADLADVEVLVAMAFTPTMAEAATGLRLLQVPGAGLDRIDRQALRPETALANVHGHESGIADYVIGAMIALSRSFARIDAALREGRWESQWAVGRAPPPLWPELAGKTLGILGFGHIGAAVARRALAFDMRIRAIRRRAAAPVPAGVEVGGPEALDALLRAADHLLITLPLSDETRGLIDQRRLALMKPSAILINVARAESVDETALYQALLAGRLGGAALDVWYRYPSGAGPMVPAAAPFQELENVLMTPHVSGWTEGMLAARASLIAANIERIARGEPPENAIGPAA
jgi:phosphoglycerate dehydrogenase-like enzyme